MRHQTVKRDVQEGEEAREKEGADELNPAPRRVESASLRWRGHLHELILIFETSRISRYDDAQMYCFRSEGGTEKEWLLQEDEPLELREQYFERLVDG